MVNRIVGWWKEGRAPIFLYNLAGLIMAPRPLIYIWLSGFQLRKTPCGLVGFGRYRDAVYCPEHGADYSACREASGGE